MSCADRRKPAGGHNDLAAAVEADSGISTSRDPITARGPVQTDRSEISWRGQPPPDTPAARPGRQVGSPGGDSCASPAGVPGPHGRVGPVAGPPPPDLHLLQRPRLDGHECVRCVADGARRSRGRGRVAPEFLGTDTNRRSATDRRCPTRRSGTTSCPPTLSPNRCREVSAAGLTGSRTARPRSRTRPPGRSSYASTTARHAGPTCGQPPRVTSGSRFRPAMTVTTYDLRPSGLVCAATVTINRAVPALGTVAHRWRSSSCRAERA